MISVLVMPVGLIYYTSRVTHLVRILMGNYKTCMSVYKLWKAMHMGGKPHLGLGLGDVEGIEDEAMFGITVEGLQ